MKSVLVHSDSEILGGTPVCVGTRVPVRLLFEQLEAGDPLEVFLEDAKAALVEGAHPAGRVRAGVLLTADKGMEYRQNQAPLPVAILVARAKSNRMEDLARAVPSIPDALVELPPRALRKVVA